MIDVFAIILGILISSLLIITTYAAVEYYRRLDKAHKEYEKAKMSSKISY